MIIHLTNLLTCTDTLPIQGVYKLWIYRNYIIFLLQFHSCLDTIPIWNISKLVCITTFFLKKWLKLPRSASKVILIYYLVSQGYLYVKQGKA